MTIEQPALKSALQEAHRLGTPEIWANESGPAIFREIPGRLLETLPELEGEEVIYDLLSAMEPGPRRALYQQGHHQEVRGEFKSEDGLSTLRYLASLNKGKFSHKVTAVIRVQVRKIDPEFDGAESEAAKEAA